MSEEDVHWTNGIPSDWRFLYDEGVREMTRPVRCLSCRGIYDSAHVEIGTRYLDCSIWACPHCDRPQDSRSEQPFLLVGAETHTLLEEEAKSFNGWWRHRMFLGG